MRQNCTPSSPEEEPGPFGRLLPISSNYSWGQPAQFHFYGETCWRFYGELDLCKSAVVKPRLILCSGCLQIETTVLIGGSFCPCAASKKSGSKPQPLLSLSIFVDGTVMCREKTWRESGLWGLSVWAPSSYRRESTRRCCSRLEDQVQQSRKRTITFSGAAEWL